MRCSNMKIADILIFLTNCMTISSLIARKEKTSASTVNEHLVNKIDTDCPFLTRIIKDDSVRDYTVNCKRLTTEKIKVKEEIVLQNACSLVNNMIHYMCENKLNPSNEDLNLGFNDPTPFCPFNFTSLAQLRVVDFIHKDIEEVLTNEKLCSRVCYDLDEPKKQCIILNKVNKYLESYQKQKVPANIEPLKTKLSLQPASQVSGDVMQHPVKNLSPQEPELPMTVEQSEAEKLSLPQSKPVVTTQHYKTEKFSQLEPELSVPAEQSEVKNPSSSQFKLPVNTLHETEKNNLSYEAKQNEKPLESLKEGKINEINTETAENNKNVHLSTENNKETKLKEKNNLKPIADSTSRDEKISTNANTIKNSPSLENDNSINPEQDVIDEDDDLQPPFLDNQNPDMEKADDIESLNKVSAIKIHQTDLHEERYPESQQIYSGSGFFSAGESHFFFYFIMISSAVVICYLAYHNKNKILAYALEGSNGRRGRRRPNPARYRKLETNLEEVISSNTPRAASSSVVY